jgi:hypothetical protein
MEKAAGMGRAKRLLKDQEAHSIFGFNNPEPMPGCEDYGYEFWIKIEPGMALDDVAFKEFDGVLYAVTTCKVLISPWKDIPENIGKVGKLG